jgi:CDP-diacylglycerol---glycerol-3-phosphate 3-phosphatidyltransferase
MTITGPFAFPRIPSIAFPCPVGDNQVWFPGRVSGAHPEVVNLPNSITLIRIFSIPLLIWILSSARFSSQNGEKELLASALFIAASMTDGIDGYLARKRGQITTMGILLDPLADKLLIAAAFVTLVQFNPSLVPAWIAVVIIGREFLVSGLRSIAASEGFTIEASELGKFKMVIQIVSVVAVILDHRWKEWPVYGNYFFPVHWIAYLAIWFMVCVSLVSAVDYFIAFWSKIDRRVVKRQRRAFILSRRRKPVPVPPQADRDVATTT